MTYYLGRDFCGDITHVYKVSPPQHVVVYILLNRNYVTAGRWVTIDDVRKSCWDGNGEYLIKSNLGALLLGATL